MLNQTAWNSILALYIKILKQVLKNSGLAMKCDRAWQTLIKPNTTLKLNIPDKQFISVLIYNKKECWTQFHKHSNE